METDAQPFARSTLSSEEAAEGVRGSPLARPGWAEERTFDDVVEELREAHAREVAAAATASGDACTWRSSASTANSRSESSMKSDKDGEEVVELVSIKSREFTPGDCPTQRAPSPQPPNLEPPTLPRFSNPCSTAQPCPKSTHGLGGRTTLPVNLSPMAPRGNHAGGSVSSRSTTPALVGLQAARATSVRFASVVPEEEGAMHREGHNGSAARPSRDGEGSQHVDEKGQHTRSTLDEGSINGQLSASSEDGENGESLDRLSTLSGGLKNPRNKCSVQSSSVQKAMKRGRSNFREGSTVLFSADVVELEDQKEAQAEVDQMELREADEYKPEVYKLKQWCAAIATGGSTNNFSRHCCSSTGSMAGEEFQGSLWHCLVQHPNSLTSVYMDMFSMLFIAHDLCTIPLEVFEPEETTTFAMVVMWMGSLFWSMDLVHRFFTGFYKDGEVVMSPRLVAKNYIYSWFLVDLLMVLCDWMRLITLHIDSSDSALKEVEAMRPLRNLRMVRLLRSMKASELLRVFEDRICSDSVLSIFSLGKLFFSLVAIIHIFACTWYWIGNKSVKAEDTHNWLRMYLDVDLDSTDVSMEYRYMTSFHWALTQFTPGSISVQPTNLSERVFGNFVLLFALIVISSFTSRITGAIVQLGAINSVKSRQFYLLRRYLKEHHVNTHLAVRIQKFCHHAIKCKSSSINEDNVELLSFLSMPLMSELRSAIAAPTLVRHAFFALLNEGSRETTREICFQATMEVFLVQADSLFVAGDQATRMLFVTGGELSYTWKWKDRSGSQEVQPGTWNCEAALWINWQCRGLLSAMRDSMLVSVDADKFANAIQADMDAWKEAINYAGMFLRSLNRIDPWKLNDLFVTPVHEGLWFRIQREYQGVRGYRSIRSLFLSRRWRMLEKVLPRGSVEREEHTPSIALNSREIFCG